MGAFDDAPIVDEPAEEGEVPCGGVSLEETGLGAIDGKDDGWWRHGTIVTPDGGFVFSDTRLGEIASPIGKAHMKHTLLLTLVAGALFGAGFAAKQVEKLQARMAAADGFLQADTTVEKDAALYPEKFKQKISDRWRRWLRCRKRSRGWRRSGASRMGRTTLGLRALRGRASTTGTPAGR
jgi:hypothetical protein